MHHILCHITKIFFGINQGLLTLNMGLAGIAPSGALCEGLKMKENKNMHFIILGATNI
jgi:hypothetical protein